MDQNSLKPIASCSNSVDKGKHSGHVVTLTGQAAIRPCPACPSRSRPRDRRARMAGCCQDLPASRRAAAVAKPRRAPRTRPGRRPPVWPHHDRAPSHAPTRPPYPFDAWTPRALATKPSPKPPPRSLSSSRRRRPPWPPLMPSDRAHIHHLTTPLQLIQRTHRARLSSLKPPMPSTSPTIPDPAPWSSQLRTRGHRGGPPPA